MLRLKNSVPKINIAGELWLNEAMAGHTPFRVGGPADVYAIPENLADLRSLVHWAESESVPFFVLGGGANILVSDAGIRGLVIDMKKFNGISTSGTAKGVVLHAGAGLAVSDASAWAADRGLSGLEFIYAMPGSVAGAVWMNARC